MVFTVHAFIVANDGHIGDFSGIRTKKGKTLSFNQYPVNIFRSSTLSRKCQSSYFLFCNARCTPQVVTLIWPPFNSSFPTTDSGIVSPGLDLIYNIAR